MCKKSVFNLNNLNMKFRISHPGFGDFGLRVWVWVCFSVRNTAHVEDRIENVQLKKCDS